MKLASTAICCCDKCEEVLLSIDPGARPGPARRRPTSTRQPALKERKREKEKRLPALRVYLYRGYENRDIGLLLHYKEGRRRQHDRKILPCSFLKMPWMNLMILEPLWCGSGCIFLILEVIFLLYTSKILFMLSDKEVFQDNTMMIEYIM